MANKKIVEEELKLRYLNGIKEHLELMGEEVLRVGSNAVAIPCVDNENNEQTIVINFVLKKGTREGEPYDPYAMAEDYELNLKLKEEKKKKMAELKAKKIAKDKAYREKMKKQREGAK